jgi:hypothetical protein
VSSLLSECCKRETRPLRGACGIFLLYTLQQQQHPTSEASQRHVCSNTCINSTELDFESTDLLDASHVLAMFLPGKMFELINWRLGLSAQRKLRRSCSGDEASKVHLLHYTIHKSRDTLHSFIIATRKPHHIIASPGTTNKRSTSGSNRPLGAIGEKLADC